MRRGEGADERRASRRSPVRRARAVGLAVALACAALAGPGARADAPATPSAPAASDAAPAAPDAAPARRIAFSAEITIRGVPEGAGPVDVWVPIPVNDERQGVESYSVRSGMPGRVVRDARGNRFWHGRAGAAPELPMEITLEAVVARRAVGAPPARALADDERAARARLASPSDGIPSDAAALAPVVAALHERAGSERPLALARAARDWVAEHVAAGDGAADACAGDALAALAGRRGGPGDAAALEAALVRAAGVPARIAVGLAVPTGVAKGEASERRTWVEVLAPEAGWVPLDALAAGADALAGAAPGAAFDRLHVTTGCGLVLGDGQRDARPLPSVATTYVEVDGRRVDGGVETHFPFADLATAQLLGP